MSARQSLLFLSLVGVALAATGSPAAAGGVSSSANEITSQLTTCIDDSDCKKLGQGNIFACFMYICYPWQNDESVAPEERRDTCRKSSDCKQDQTCFRHHDKRNINRGLCFNEVADCEAETDCSEGYGCCGGFCCEQEYHAHFTDLPCSSDFGCQDMNLGKFCCPQNNASAICCNTDPNPPPATPPRASASSAHVSVRLASEMLVLLVVLPAMILAKQM